MDFTKLIVNIVCQIGCAVTQSFGGMIVARFFLGVGGCKSANTF